MRVGKQGQRLNTSINQLSDRAQDKETFKIKLLPSRTADLEAYHTLVRLLIGRFVSCYNSCSVFQHSGGLPGA